MPIVRIKNILYFASNHGVILEWGALEVTPEELQKTVQLAFEHLHDKPLVEACCGGYGPLANHREIQFEDYLQLLNKIEIEEAALEAKRRHTKIRRSHFNSSQRVPVSEEAYLNRGATVRGEVEASDAGDKEWLN